MVKRKAITYSSDDEEVHAVPPSSPDRPLGQSARRTGKKAKKVRAANPIAYWLERGHDLANTQQDSDSDIEEVKVSKPVNRPKSSGSKPQVCTQLVLYLRLLNASQSTKKPSLDKPSRDKKDSPQASSPHEFKVGVNDRGEKYIDLGKNRRATVNTFKGGKFVDIREFYGDDSDLKPGKKGISLSQEQWETLKSSADVIDSFFARLK
ncbi:transcriptional Coactivator p15-domain-containing protein [Daedaleopsis nitida]|nr:transcriptional Coactivator p15-domain-containing protein [Daedaleopsis nitida]